MKWHIHWQRCGARDIVAIYPTLRQNVGTVGRHFDFSGCMYLVRCHSTNLQKIELKERKNDRRTAWHRRGFTLGQGQSPQI